MHKIAPLKNAFAMGDPIMTTRNADICVARAGAADWQGKRQVVIKRVHLTRTRTGQRSVAATVPSDDPGRELRVAMKLAAMGGHCNIVRFYGAFVAKNALHMVMEHCDDGDLFQHLKQQPDQRLAERDALAVLLQVARGVKFLHDNNIAHRDISVENVLVEHGTFKLCDFGLSASADALCYGSVGKANYQAPEVVDDKAAYDPVRADIWSLGIVLFVLLTGSPLVQIASLHRPDFRAFVQVGVEGVLRGWKMDKLVGYATLDLLNGMLQLRPDDRWASMGAVLDHPALLGAAARERRAKA